MDNNLIPIDFLFIIIGMTTIIVFSFKREWLLNQKFSLILMCINLLLLILGYVFEYNSIGNPKMVVAIKMPILSQLIFIVLVYIFRKIYNRNPVDTFWSMDLSLMKDGIFNFLFWLLAIVLPAILVFTKVI